MAPIVGAYTLSKSENFEEFMKALGVGLMMRKMGASATPVVTFTESSGEYTMKTVTSLKSSEIKFKIGTQFKETTMDGRESNTTFTLDGNKLTQVQVPVKGDKATYVRTFTDAELVCECETAGVKSTRTYKRN